MSANCEIIVIFPIYGQFEAIRKTDSGCIVCSALIVIFYLTKTETRTKNSNTARILLI